VTGFETGPEPCSTEWAQVQVAEFARRRDDYLLLGRVLQEVLMHAADEYAPLSIVQVRAKSIPSFAEKCLRKCAKYRSPVDQLTDLCGARVIVHTQEQVERISRFLEEHFEVDWANSEDIGRRLKTSEFGYRSVHYIVTFKPGAFPTRKVPVEVPPLLLGGEQGMSNPRAEVQVRTLLQHAWADTGHDLLYKGGFEAPEVWKREYARLAATLETADGVVARVHEGVRGFVSCYGAYMTVRQMEEELQLLDFVRRHDPGNAELALRIAGIANAAGRWQVAVDALEPFEASGDAAVLRELGIACCGLGDEAGERSLGSRGRRLLEQAAQDPDDGGPALLALAASWRGEDEERSRVEFARAFEALPGDPHALAGYLEHEIAFLHNLSPLTAARPAVASAVETCESRVRAGVDLPGACFAAGLLSLLLGRAYESLDWYAKGVQLSADARQIESALRSLQHIKSVADHLEGYPWMVRLLELGRVTPPREASLDSLRALATANGEPFAGPVLMVAGGCDPAKAEQFEGYRDLLVQGLGEFRGTVISGGTRQGVSGFVGDAAEQHPGIRAVSYLPRLLPLDSSLDHRYAEVRPIDDAGFTPMAPLQAWTDLVASGVGPAEVRLLGINGGRVSAAEYRIALALGATVALLEDSGREAAKLLPDERWGLSERLLRLPADWAAVRAFAEAAGPSFPGDLRESVGRALHEQFLSARMRELRPQEPGLAPWDELLSEYRESVMRQADDIFAKLALVGLEAVPCERPAPFAIPEGDVELLAEVEHGRWMVERLLGGWRWGPVKDVKARISPYLVPWDRLAEQTREWDRVFIRAIPATLAEHGLEVRKKG